MSRATRSTVGCPIFGAPADLPKSKLPTVADILRFYQFHRYQLKSSTLEPSFDAIRAQILPEIKARWGTADLPIVSDQQIVNVLKKVKKDYSKAVEQFQKVDGDGNTANILNKISNYRDESELKLFDLCSCKCPDPFACSGRHTKVPKGEIPFLVDQRTVRMMAIGPIDVAQSRVLAKRHQRQQEQQERLERQRAEASNADLSSSFISEFDESDHGETEEEETSDDDWKPTERIRKNNINLSLFAIEADRVGVSNVGAARLCNALLTSLGIVNEDDRSEIVDKSKMMRAREKVQKVLVKSAFELNSQLKSLYFDGRRDKTRVRLTNGKSITKKEDHYSLVTGEGNFIGHITVPHSDNSQIKVCIFTLLSRFLN